MTKFGAGDLVSVRHAHLVTLEGGLTAHTCDEVAASLRTATADLWSPTVLILDLRQLTALTAPGARVLRDLTAAVAERGVSCRAVIESGSVIARLLNTPALGLLTMPQFTSVEEASAGTTEVNRLGAGDDPDAETDLLVEHVEALTRTLLGTGSVGAALQQVVDATLLAVRDADMVSVTLRAPDGEFFTPAQTDSAAVELDQVQYRFADGPCVDVADPNTPGYVTSHELDSENRWPHFSAAAADCGYRAVLSTELLAPENSTLVSGALNIYSHQRGGFTETDRNAALLLAAHASLALAHTRAVELADLQKAQLRQAIDTRDVIGQAKGILMNRQGITADDAFTRLRQTSQDLNIKLVELARTLTEHHTDLDGPEHKPRR